jgi:hypothetical protein
MLWNLLAPYTNRTASPEVFEAVFRILRKAARTLKACGEKPYSRWFPDNR